MVRTPASPGFYWGNFLLYRRPPADGDFERWMQRFDEGHRARAQPGTGHVAFGIDEPSDGVVVPPAFAAAGFDCIPGQC